MSNSVTELCILYEGGNIFDTDVKYEIPLYQRAYAWEDKELIQLVEDINDVAENASYYIGSLIVSRQDDKYEVVDGQQRLTSLYLLLNCLGLRVEQNLKFACRDKSNYTLEHIGDLLSDDRSRLDMDRIEFGIQRGVKILTEELNKNDFDRESFLEKLSRVVVFRIEVPENTDLNRYFEIMNTRGEQLEQHDILKATLMSSLPRDEQMAFAKIWGACSDMTGYVQMHFISRANSVRDQLFGTGWGAMPPADWNGYREAIKAADMKGEGLKISDIIAPKFEIAEDDGYLDDDVRVRFESVIEFPYFLLHTLKVLIALKGITHEDGKSAVIAELLDDKKLIDSFDKVISHGVADSRKLSDNKADFSRAFIICLLRTRYLFDKYIIKREYANESSEGEWSLKSLGVSGQKNKRKAYYRNTSFLKLWERETTNDKRTKANIMIQSALRVSYTSPKVMHWITKLLIWLSENNCEHLHNDDIVHYTEITENIAKAGVRENFFDVCTNGKYDMGVYTPHIVFNYLDYLIWKENKTKYEDFTFEFRNSVEHWYPQNPSEGTFEQWKDGVNQFGNLCIIQRNVNSKFSNMSPEAKKSTFREMIGKGSLKLRIMRDLTVPHGDKSASLYWKETAYRAHEAQMLKLLKDACGVEPVTAPPEDTNPTEPVVETPATTVPVAPEGVARLILEWAKEKEAAGLIQLDLNKCGKKYIRFRTAVMSAILPEAETAASGWGTKTHYYYEIINAQGKRINMKLATSGLNLPDDQRKICDRINEIFPSRFHKVNWEWRSHCITEIVRLDENLTSHDLTEILEKLFAELMADQAKIAAYFRES